MSGDNPVTATAAARSRDDAAAMLGVQRMAAVEMVSCQACWCPWTAHYNSGPGGGAGCITCEAGGRACPVYVPGFLPRHIGHHLNPLDGEGPCPWLCGHPVSAHSGTDHGCMDCGCRYGAPGAAPPSGITYRGYPAADPGGHRIVVIEAPEGTAITRLPEAGPGTTGFGWGDGGTEVHGGLARSLLISALGPAAVCPSCRGARADDGSARPCECEDGYRQDLPWLEFKYTVVRSWDRDSGWAISRADILDWLADRAPDLHAAALAAVPGETR